MSRAGNALFRCGIVEKGLVTKMHPLVTCYGFMTRFTQNGFPEVSHGLSRILS